MNPFLLSISSGGAFFFGMAVCGGGMGLRLRAARRRWRAVLAVTSLVGAVLVVLSATPASPWAYALWAVCLLAALGLQDFRPGGRPPRRAAAVATGLLGLVCLLLFLLELPYHFRPRIPVQPGETIYVLGDSISAGAGTRERNWPEVLADRTGLKVVNLAQPGATVASAIEQAKRIGDGRSVVLVEIGGNDLLSGADGRTFRRDLDRLLAKLARDNRRLAMFELPLVPLANRLGRAQRALAAKYHAALIPKRVLTGVLATPGATIDGLHLSQVGHDRLAGTVGQMLVPAAW